MHILGAFHILTFLPRQTKSLAESSCTDAEPRRLQEFEEGRGLLIHVLEEPGYVVAHFEWGALALPGELAPQLRELIGKRVGVLRLDGYRIKTL
jgi:hypothetical protein